ncbi:hypothetical protein [Scytonema sp. NUACC26]
METKSWLDGFWQLGLAGCLGLVGLGDPKYYTGKRVGTSSQNYCC